MYVNSKLAFATAVVVIATMMGVSFTTANSLGVNVIPDPTIGSTTSATLNPGEILELAQRGEEITLPTVDGPIAVTLLSSGSIVRVIDTAPDGTPVDKPYRTNIWTIAPSGGTSSLTAVTGTVLLREDIIKAKINSDRGVTMIEPAEGYLPGDVATEYVVYRPGDKIRPPGAVEGFEGETKDSHDVIPTIPQSIEMPLTHTVYKTLTIYVDNEFRNQWGGLTWPDQVAYIMSLVNGRMMDVKLQYTLNTMAYDSGFDTTSETTSWNRITTIDKLGNAVAGAFVYRDWGGCVIGRAYQPGDRMHIQQKADACHSGLTPVNDFDRYYLSTHEFAHNVNADHGYADYWFTFHSHRDITQESAWYHYHDYLSAGNTARMKANLGT